MSQDYACGILVRDGRILLGLRAPHRRLYPNRWDVLGGRCEAGETLHQALVRELSEELGIVPLVTRPAGLIKDRAAHLEGLLKYHMLLVEAWSGGEPRIANSEHVRLDWFTPQDAAGLPDLAVADYRLFFLSLAPILNALPN